MSFMRRYCRHKINGKGESMMCKFIKHLFHCNKMKKMLDRNAFRWGEEFVDKE